MKKFISLFLLCFIALGISSCSPKAPSIENTEKPSPHNNIDIKRTETSDNDTIPLPENPEINNDSSAPKPNEKPKKNQSEPAENKGPKPKEEPKKTQQKPAENKLTKEQAPKKETPAKKTKKIKPLGKYSTPILNKNKDRVSNIRLAAKKINNYRLKPGDVFSFNDVVGKRDEENGFKVATIIVKGELDEDLGGGVCQLSSTLYNAAFEAGLEVVERHPHSRPISYLPSGRDAAVSYGYLDFKFKNNKDYTIKIKAWVEKGKVYTSIYKSK